MDRVFFKCERCGKEFDISKYAMNVRIKNKNFICKSCHTSESIKKHWENMSEEKKQARSKKLSDSNKAYYNSLSDAEKENIRQKISNYFANLSYIEKENFRNRQREGWVNMPPEKKQAFIQSHLDYYANMSKDDHDKFVQLHKDGWANKPNEEIHQFSQFKKSQYQNLPSEEKEKYRTRGLVNWEKVKDKVQSGHKQWLMDLSEEDKQAISNKTKEWWNNLSDDERIDFVSKRHEWYNKLTPEERQNHVDKSHQWFKELSKEEFDAYREKLSEGLKRYWSNASNKEHDSRSNKIKSIWDNMDDDEKLCRSLKISRTKRNLWSSLSQEEKNNRLSIKVVAKKVSGLTYKFIQYWNKNNLSEYFSLITEYSAKNNGICHKWDFAILDQNNDLVMVVDLDGAYYHADNCDYDGIHSILHYDIERCKSIENSVIHIIIQELNFDNCFNEMLNALSMDAGLYIEYLFKKFRAMPFPSPHFNIINLLQSYNRLCNLKLNANYYQLIEYNTRIGDRLIHHFHPSIWNQHYGNKLSPHDAWKNDLILKQLIRDKIITQSHLNPNKILSGFMISDVAPMVEFISPAQWKLILMRYWDYDTINIINGDPSLLLASISLKKNCIGEFNNDTLSMLDFLKEYEIKFNLSANGDAGVVIHVNDVNEMSEIVSKYSCKHYLFVLNECNINCDEFHIRGCNNRKYYVLKIEKS